MSNAARFTRLRSLVGTITPNGFLILKARSVRVTTCNGNVNMETHVTATCPKCKKPFTRSLQNMRAIKSCGCAQYLGFNRRHGMCDTPEYHAWSSMRQRCDNPNILHYHSYGGRGIRYDPRWKSFIAFYNDVGPRPSHNHSLERKDVNAGYWKSNVTWALELDQASNQRRNVRVTYNGKTQTASQWAREINISPAAFYSRLKRMSVHDAITMPAQTKGRRIGFAQTDQFKPKAIDWNLMLYALKAAQTCTGPRKRGECPICGGLGTNHLVRCSLGQVLAKYTYKPEV
jgi:hypothetical protein